MNYQEKKPMPEQKPGKEAQQTNPKHIKGEEEDMPKHRQETEHKKEKGSKGDW
jgi:hypothetical protein